MFSLIIWYITLQTLQIYNHVFLMVLTYQVMSLFIKTKNQGGGAGGA